MTMSHSVKGVKGGKGRTKMTSGVLAMLAISSILVASIIVTDPVATASFVTPTISNSNTASPKNDETGYMPGVQPLTTADLATPSALAAASSCQGAGSAKIAVSLSWGDSQSSSLNADQNPLLSGYTVWRSTSPSGPFTQAGSVTSSGSTQAATSYTDVNPSGAPTPYAYVANVNAGTVSVVDTSTNAVTTTITLPTPTGGTTPEPDAVAITPDGSYAYVADYANGVVDVIDTSTNAVTAPVTLPTPTGGTTPGPDAVAITPNGSYAYVADYANGVVDVIDTSTNAVTTTIALPAPNSRFTYAPDAVAITPDGSYAYVSVDIYKTATGAAENGVVDVIDTSTNAVTTTITLTEPAGGVPPIPTAVAVTPNGCSVYVTDFDNDIVDVIDTSSNAVTTTITLTDAPNLEPFGIAITPNDQAAYVPTYYNYSASTYTTIVDPLDLANDTLGSTITVGSGPYAVAVQPSTYYYEVQAYATNWTSAYSAVIPITLGFVY